MCGENSLEHQSAHENSDAQAALWTWLVLSENHIRFSSGTYLDVTESLDEIAVKIGARSAMSKATKVWEDGGQTTDRPGRRRVLRGG